MKLSQSVAKMWKARDELSPRNLRAGFFPAILVLPLAIIIGDLRFLDQQLVVFGIDANNLIMMFFGLGFLPVLFVNERFMPALLRVSVLAQTALLAAQLVMGAGMPRLFVYLAFHAASGVCTACGFHLFAFALNNVERLFTMVFAQLYYAFTYIFFQFEPVLSFFRTFGSCLVMLALVAVSFLAKASAKSENAPPPALGAKESGIRAIIALNMIYYVITLMAMYIGYQEAAVSAALYGIGGAAAVLAVIIVMLVFNYSALHLWSLCLVCSVLGIGALHYASAFATGAGSVFYGLGEGLGFMIIFYLQGGALKRGGSFRLFRLCCLFSCVHYVVISGAFYGFYSSVDAPNLALAFPAVLVLAMACFLFSPILHDRLFRTDWTDGFHMVDMPRYAEALTQAKQAAAEIDLGLTPREMEVFTMLLTDAAPKQIASTLRVSYATVNFHSKNLYRKLGIQSRTELFALYGSKQSTPMK